MPARIMLLRISQFGLIIAAALAGVLVLFSSGRTQQVLVNSATLAAGATAIALPAGTLLALLLTRFRLPGRNMAASALGVLLFLPLYVQLSGWDAAIGKLGWYSLAYGSGATPWLAGMRAAILIHALAAIPWVALIVGLGLAQVDSREEEAGRMENSSLDVLLRITLPQCWSFLLAAALWVAVSTANEMTVTNIYLIDPREMTFTEQFYMNFSLAADATEATLGVLPGLVGLSLLVATTLWMVAHITRRRRLDGQRNHMALNAGRAVLPLTAILWGIISLLLGIPLVSLIAKAGFEVEQAGSGRIRSWSLAKTWEVVSQTPQAFASEFQGTALIAGAAATLALLVAILLGWPARRGGWRAGPAMIATAVSLALPGPLVGVLLIAALNQESSIWLVWLYDKTIFAPVLAQAIRAAPITILIVWQSVGSLSDDMLAAAALDGSHGPSVLWRIALPQRWLAFAGAWLAAFATAAGDLAWSHLVMPPGVDTLARRVFGLVHSGVEEQVAGICLVVVAAYVALAGLVLSLRGGRSYTSRLRG